jgi:hypothetical protein
MGDLFDAAEMYDEDYLYFFAAPRGLSEFAVHGPVVPGADFPGAAAADLAWRLLELRPGMSVLDRLRQPSPGPAWSPTADGAGVMTAVSRDGPGPRR